MTLFEQRKIELQYVVDYLATKNINAAYIGGGLMEVIYNSKRTLIYASLPDAIDYVLELKRNAA
jgi:hypothetical protein